jgi:hypothetical protein
MTWTKAIAIFVCGLLGVVLTPACDSLGLGNGAGGGTCEGAGGFGGAGGEAPDPCIVPDTPCKEKCYTEYEQEASVCGTISSDADRKTCQENGYATYKQCRTACDKDPVEQCKKLCDKENIRCIAKCPNGNKACLDNCNQKYGKCLKDCK